MSDMFLGFGWLWRFASFGGVGFRRFDVGGLGGLLLGGWFGFMFGL